MDNRIFNRSSVDSNKIVGEFPLDEDCCSTEIGFACGRSISPVGEKVG